jgi:hypothetical protein
MKMSYTTPNGRLTFELEADTGKTAFAIVARIQELFEEPGKKLGIEHIAVSALKEAMTQTGVDWKPKFSGNSNGKWAARVEAMLGEKIAAMNEEIEVLQADNVKLRAALSDLYKRLGETPPISTGIVPVPKNRIAEINTGDHH